MTPVIFNSIKGGLKIDDCSPQSLLPLKNTPKGAVTNVSQSTPVSQGEVAVYAY